VEFARLKVLCLALIAVLACSARGEAGALSYSIGGGYVPSYTSGDHLRFGATGLTAASAGWRWNSRIALTGSVGHLSYESPAAVYYILPALGPPPPPTVWGVSAIPVSVGVVGYLRGGERVTPFAEISPALVWTHWFVEGGYGNSEFTAVVPGLRAGLGMHFPVSPQLELDVGILYLFSGSGRIQSQDMRVLAAQERFDPLNQASPFAQLTLTP
jgi:hypothetical protein